MAGLAILKHMHDLSDEVLCDRWVENPYFQYFCGEDPFQHGLVFDRLLARRVGANAYAKRSFWLCCRRAWRLRPEPKR